MRKIVIFLSNGYADYEIAYLSSFLKMNNEELIFIAPEKEITSKGGITSSVSFTLNDFIYSSNYDALILVGGRYWRSINFVNTSLNQLIDQFVKDHKVVASICDASTYLANNGYFNNKHHTGNGKEYLSNTANPQKYLSSNLYLEKQVVKDLPFISSNGTAGIEFGKEVAEALNIGNEESRNAFFLYHHTRLYQN